LACATASAVAVAATPAITGTRFCAASMVVCHHGGALLALR
jgi:peptidoglycan/LPS O-acetylase OafA/YrhL